MASVSVRLTPPDGWEIVRVAPIDGLTGRASGDDLRRDGDEYVGEAHVPDGRSITLKATMVRHPTAGADARDWTPRAGEGVRVIGASPEHYGAAGVVDHRAGDAWVVRFGGGTLAAFLPHALAPLAPPGPSREGTDERVVRRR